MDLFKDFDFDIEKDNIKVLFEYFFKNVMFSLILFCICVIYIFITEKNKKVKDLFVWYILGVILIVWNPLVTYFLGKFINFSSMYRLYYTIPMYPIIAYSFTKLVSNFKKTWLKLIGMIAVCSIVIIFGRNVYDDWALQKYGNLYKLPDETVFVAEVIYRDDKYKDKKAIVPYGMSSQIQQIYSSIDLVYTRIISNQTKENGRPSPSDTDDPGDNEVIKKFNEGDMEYIVELCNRENVNYIVVSDITQLKRPLEELGFEKLEAGYGVTVYRKV